MAIQNCVYLIPRCVAAYQHVEPGPGKRLSDVRSGEHRRPGRRLRLGAIRACGSDFKRPTRRSSLARAAGLITKAGTPVYHMA